MNEDDEEIIKKLMNMLGNGREIKFKSANGQTIRVAYEGSSFNETEPESSKDHSEEQHHHEDPAEQAFMSEESHNNSLQEEKLEFFGDIQEDLKEMEDDFHALSRIKEGKGECSEDE